MNVVVYGAGSIGCYLGAVLCQQGINVVLLGRERLQARAQQRGGIALSDYEGRDDFVPNIAYETEPQVLSKADVILVTLKCTAMEDAANTLAQYVKKDALVVCLQNGVGAERPVIEKVKQAEVCCGIVPFNVVQGEEAQFHRATQGQLYLPKHSKLEAVAKACNDYGLSCVLSADMPAIIWGKLLLNLNNAINALSDLPLKEQLSMRGYRKVLAQCQKELLVACRKKGIVLAQLTAVKPQWLPIILRLPNWLFRLVAQKMLAIDPKARSSMWEDIQANRATEIAFLNGAVVTLAQEVGEQAPANQAVSQLLTRLSQAHISTPIRAQKILSQISQQ